MYVIFDTNVWMSELGLNSTVGSAVRFFVKHKGATVVLPEVIKLETERNLTAALTKHLEDLQKNYRSLLAVFGQLKDIVLPNTESVYEKVSSIFTNCQLQLIEVPFSLESTLSSYMRTIEKIPPSEKSQQFKDGVIWAECVRFMETGDVYFVTNDTAFYQDRNIKLGLATCLKDEIKEKPHNFFIFHELGEFLKEIRTEVTIDQEKLITTFWEQYRQSLEGMLERNHFAATGVPSISTQLFVTENANRLYSEFEAIFSCEDLLCEGRSATLSFKGDCTYLVAEKDFINLRSHGEELSFMTDEGPQKSQSGYIYCDGIVIGHKNAEHTVKASLSEF